MSDFTAEDIRRIAREEIRRFVDAGLMYTEESVNAPKAKPEQPTPQPVNPVIAKFPVELQQHLTEKNGQIFSEYVSNEKWKAINAEAKALGYKWISDGKNSRWVK
jgi:hypothetical protein